MLTSTAITATALFIPGSRLHENSSRAYYVNETGRQSYRDHHSRLDDELSTCQLVIVN